MLYKDLKCDVKFGLMLLWALAASAVAAAPIDATVTFQMKWGGIHIADVTDTLEFDDGSYKITSQAIPVGVAEMLGEPPINRLSTGTYTDDGVLMTEYYEQERDGETRTSRIDRAAGMVFMEKENGTKLEGEIILDAVNDYLTILYSFYATGSAQAGRAHLTDGRRLIEYEYFVEDTPILVTTDIGEFEALQFQRQTKPGREYLVWFVPELRYIPGRILLSRSDFTFEFTLTSVEFAAEPSS